MLNGALRVHPCANEAEEARWIVDRIDEHLKIGTHPDIEGPVESLARVRADGSFWSRTWPELVTACRTLDRDFSQLPHVLDGLDRMLRESAKDHDGSTASEEWAVAIADIDYLQQIWRNYTRHFTADARGIGHFRNQMAMGVTVPHGDPKGLTLGTIHTVKGLEYDIVFVMGLCEGSFPDYRAVRAGGNALAEEKNDAFVAITRSKRLLYLSWPKARFMPWDMENRVRQNRSRFLDEIIRKNDESITDPVFQVAENPHP